ncbi:tyrosinase family protein [Aestuariicoccus sp. MJ-SS9]|uniref:tyrosinase family protein n=1 Tax=Aestuariicoccus sp. MJ-SS9 TaxID=3079855 RepID=UPI002910190F|nr:tyrosinase family protein [Aestuariicoccus sp. MJ-SS9]MDU8909659.1 tyrosinase family protein [Aestuariicoccus sp. MJ-SS9]
MTDIPHLKTTRRSVLRGALAGSVALAAPALLSAQGTYAGIRKNVMAKDAQEDVDSYRAGVAEMLKLDPDHPHNWYRNAFIHLLDCPHGNWWFFVWHRPFLAYFEHKIRIHSKNPEFSLPYWDWSTEQRLPAAMFGSDNALDPTSSHFPADWASFAADYEDATRAYWESFDDAQLAQETIRGNTGFDMFWNGWGGSVQANFATPRSIGRTKTAQNPDLTDRALEFVQPEIVLGGLKPEIFVKPAPNDPSSAFNSPKAPNHHRGMRGSAVIEGQPHNQVHNNTGGIMPTLLSSIDPLFYLHHGNIDRLWDIWTRKQTKLGLSALPLPADAPAFNREPFLFFIDGDGNKVTQDTTAGDYMDIGRWGYSYTRATGEELVDAPPRALMVATNNASNVRTEAFSAFNAGIAGVALNEAFTNTLTAPMSQVRHIAHITFVPPENVQGLRFNFFMAPQGDTPQTAPDSPDLAGSFEFFGVVHSHSDPFTVSIDITEALNRLEATGTLVPGGELTFAMAAAEVDPSKRLDSAGAIAGQLISVDVEAI